MALYAHALATGETIKGRPIIADTIEGYITAACESAVANGSKSNPGISSISGKKDEWVQRIVTAVRRWEKMARRQEPLTKAMIDVIAEMATCTHPDSLQNAMTDWLVVGLHTGYRRCEWAQDKQPKNIPEDFQRAEDPNKSIYAVTADDVYFIDAHCCQINNPLTVDPQLIEGVRIRWKFQKNGDNGQWLTFAANHSNPSRCIGRAMQRILQRAQRLLVLNSYPLAVYRRSPGSKRPSWIVSASIIRILREAAAIAYKIDVDSERMKYTPHSIRIGACVLLHAGGANQLLLKQRLRWRSDTFMMYLRDVPAIAAQQRSIIDQTNVDSFTI